MEKTGIGLLEILAMAAGLLPLIPVLIIFFLKTYKQDVLALFMALCLIIFVQNLILYIIKFAPTDIIIIRFIFQLVIFVLLLIILNMIITGRWLQEGLKMLMVSFISVAITIYSFRYVPVYFENLQLTQALLLIVITFIALLQLIRSNDVFIFQSPMFWISAGTFFYYSMFLLTQSIPERTTDLSATQQLQKDILLLIMIIVQFVFYIIAVTITGKKKRDTRSS